MSRNKFKPKLFIKTKRLVLRSYKPSDFNAWKKTCDSMLPRQNTYDLVVPEHLLTRSGFTKWAKDRNALAKKDVVYVLGIFDKKTGEHIGTIDLAIVRRISLQCANLGYAVRNHLWNRGYAKEASKAALEIAFKQLKIHRVEAAVDPKNKASLKVAKSLGMIREGVRKNFFYHEGKWLDCIFYVVTADRFGLKKMKPTVHTKITDYL